jgi:pimeloyl-ACP methyl ester carboxylesterase
MEPIKSKHFILIPGSFHAAWCYYKLMPLLKQKGATVTSIDLPGHGRDTTPIREITLDAYVDAVCNELNKCAEPSIVVGHSRAGIILSQVAERCPEKISTAVYLCAFLIPNGEPMVATAMTDASSLLVSSLIFNEGEGWHIPKEEMLEPAFYHDCQSEDIELAKMLYCREPNLPVLTPLQLTDEHFGSVNKVYIETLSDRAITNGLQRAMLAKVPVNKVVTMDASHSPFFSRPGELAEILLSLD